MKKAYAETGNRMHTIRTLALGKLRYHKSRTLLTGLVICLTTALLTAIAACALAMFDMNKQMAVLAGDTHASLRGLSPEQISVLKNHKDIEACCLFESFGEVVYGRMNGELCTQEVLKEGFQSVDFQLKAGRIPEKADEICAGPAFFERMGVEPAVGNRISISFRVSGKGEILTQDFVISGVLDGLTLAQVEERGISDERIMYGAYVSKAFTEQYGKTEGYEPSITADIRVFGEDYLTYDEIVEKIEAVAEDVGMDAADRKDNITYNKQYLYTMTDPGIERILIVSLICLVVVLFSSLVIYSIYYVGVITDVQEIGKLKAMGASGKQIRRMLLCEGALVSLITVPAGLLLGYSLVYVLFPVVLKWINEAWFISPFAVDIKIHMFSLPAFLAVAAAVLFTVYASLLKPMRMAAKISPVEAIRYQEGSASGKLRKGRREVGVAALVCANLAGNRKRTMVTLLTMGLSFVFFMCVAGVMASMRAEDIARRMVCCGDFRLDLEYALYYDTVYPENNLDSLVQQNYFNEELTERLLAIDGVEEVVRNYGTILASVDDMSEAEIFQDDDNRIPVSYFTREDVEALEKELQRGSLDYDRMTENNEICLSGDYMFDEYGLALGDIFEMTLHDGENLIPFTGTLSASIYTGEVAVPLMGGAKFIMTEDSWKSLGLTCDPTTCLYIDVRKDRYEEIKPLLQEIAGENQHFTLYSLDEEMKIGRSAVCMIKYPVYLLLILLGVIGFMNLINTMITSIVTRRRELGILQAVGLSGRQLARMLSGEGMVFIMGTLAVSMTLGNLCGYLLFLYAKEMYFMSVSRYRYPLWESIALTVFLLLGQAGITLFVNRKVKQESVIERIRNE